MADLIQDVRDLLREGFGVEDIALRLEQPAEAVRRLVRRWQDSGEIRAILRPVHVQGGNPPPRNEATPEGASTPVEGLTETATKGRSGMAYGQYTLPKGGNQ